MTYDDFLDLLEGVQPTSGGVVSLCPGHDDSEPSMKSWEEDGKIRVNCYAGCDYARIRDAMGLEDADFWTSPRPAQAPRLEPESVYDYVNELGELLFQSLRFRTEKGKTFKQRHLDQHHEKANEDGWVWGLGDVRRVLYRLPEVLAAIAAGQTIYVVEGEKDADRLVAEGKVATCNPMGAGKWRPEYTESLRGAQTVIIVADKDETGRNHANYIRTQLDAIGVPNVWVVQAREGKDVSDHLDSGLGVEDLRVVRQTRRGVVTSSDLAEHALQRLDMTEDDLPGYLMSLEVPVVFRPGRMYAIGAYTGDGKTCFALQGYRALASAGKRVGYFSLEMPEIDLMNRLVAHRGVPLRYTEEPWRLKHDPAMYTAYVEAVEEIRQWQGEIVFDSSLNAEAIREATLDREYEVVFVDHLHRFATQDRQRLEAEVRTLTNIALEQNVLVVILCQLRKVMRGKDIVAYPRPTLQDFRETSQIGDDASMALAVWRQRDLAGMQYTGATEVIVLKNRHTTGREDIPGKSWMPAFDVDRQMFTSGIPLVQGG